MKIIYSPLAIKQLKKISPNDKIKAKKKIETIKSDPLSGKPLKGELTGLRSLKAWPLRIIYVFDLKHQIVKIVTVNYRGNVYK